MERIFAVFLGGILMVTSAEAGISDEKKEVPAELKEGTKLCQYPNIWISYTILDEMDEPAKYHIRVENSDTGMGMGAIVMIWKTRSSEGDYAIDVMSIGDRPYYSRVDNIIACNDKKKFKEKLHERSGKEK